MTWMQTYSGAKFFPFDPRPEHVDIIDIAHALSNLCRFGGHCNSFYSVAEHATHASRLVPQEGELPLKALLHDAAEAYLVDLPRPIKGNCYFDVHGDGSLMLSYSEVERKILDVIFKRFGLTPGLPAEVKYVDDGMLTVERDQIMEWTPDDWGTPRLSERVYISCDSPEWSKNLFLLRFEDLYKKADAA